MRHTSIKIDRLESVYEIFPISLAQYDIVNFFVCGNLFLLFNEIIPFLTPDEQRKADQIFSRQNRENFILRRGILRQLIAVIIGTAAGQVNILTSPQKKPYLQEGPFFSHSNKPDSLLYSFSVTTEIGSDIEKIEKGLDTKGIAKCFFSPWEREQSQGLHQFFHQWTRKEAVAKCTGKSLQACIRDEKNVYTFEQGSHCFSIASKKKIESMISYTMQIK
jgi:phosphopantetheine--protein transferase-like protein